LRERKKVATRQALAWTAMRLAIERGLDDVLVEDIAAAAGVSPRTFNNYFASKYEAICALAIDRARRIGAGLLARPAGEPLWDAITQAVVEQYSGSVAEAPDESWLSGIRLVTGAPALKGEYLKTYAEMQRALAEAIAARTGVDVERDMFPRILAGAVCAATEVAVDRWIAADPPTSLARLVRLALRELSGAFLHSDIHARSKHESRNQDARSSRGTDPLRATRRRTRSTDDSRRQRRRRPI
jgi:AcrR family transcriptional regulator